MQEAERAKIGIRTAGWKNDWKLNRVKFNIDRRLFNYSALVRSGQMSREVALDRISRINSIEDEAIIALRIKYLGLSRAKFEHIVTAPPKTFHHYPNSYVLLKWPIKVGA